MKKIVSVFVLILLLALSLYMPALALTDSNVIYDETEALGSDTLSMQGTQTLPELSERLGIDLRVDVLTQISCDSIADTAMGIYDVYGHGYGNHKEGATLTILMEPQVMGTYAMPADGWCVYVTLRQGRGSSQTLANAIRDAVEPWMAEQVWNGEDITKSAVALTRAVDAMAEAAEAYILTNCPADGFCPETSETPEVSGQSGVDMQYVYDISDLLTDKEWQELESRAAAISQAHHCGVYFVLVDDYTEYGDGGVYKVTCQLYHSNQLGMGDDREGILVLLSMEERDYAMFVYGEYAEYAFDEFGQKKLEERFLEDFGYDDWYGGISNYLDACDEFLIKANEGAPVRPSYWQYSLFLTGLGFLAAGVACLWLMRGMKTVRPKTEADAYIAKGRLCLRKQSDQFSHTIVSRSKIEKESSSSGSTTRSESGGGGSGRSGKF